MANTRITQGVIKPNENYLVGILTAQSIDVNGVLTYEDVTSIDSIGIITARKGIVSSGVVTATAFHGDGSQLTGIDATALKDPNGSVKIQAQESGAVHTGFSTMQNLRVTGIATFGTSSTVIHGDQNLINVGTALTLGHTQGVQFHTQNLHSQGFEINNINASGIITAAQFSGDGSNLENLPAGLGTALSSTQSSPLNKIYYTNTVLPVESTVTVDTPASASAAYTQYADISVGTGADLIISDGDDLIPDVLGLRPDGTFGGGSLGRMRVDKLVGKDANSAVNVEKGIVVTGVVTATSFSGSGANLTGIDATALKDSAGNVKVQANSTGAVVTGILTATTIVGAGTSGIKLPVGTTAQRDNTTGMLRFNSNTNLPEYYNGTIYVPIDSPPTISSISPTEVASDAGGNETFTITGTRFASGAVVKFISHTGTEITASTVTVNNSTQITAVIAKNSFVNAQEPYDVKVVNASGLQGLLADQINVDNAPSWTTAAGSLGTIDETATGNHFTVAATDAEGDTVSYSLQSGSLGGLSLNSSTGVISGDPTDVSADTTNSFTLRATAGGKTSDRAFSYITRNIPTFYDQIVTTMGLDTGDNLAILVDPFDPNSDSGSGTITNRSGRSGVNVNITLNGLSRGGTGTGKYWQVLTGIDSYMSFGNGITGVTNNSTDSWAYCGWWRPNFEVDQNQGILWMLNDGDWSPFSQIGIRMGQGNGWFLHSGSNHSFINTSIPSATYTNKWLFVGVFHYVGGGTVVVQGFHDDTNLTQVVFSSQNSSTGNASGHNMMIGARPDYTPEDCPTGTRIGPQAAWYGGSNSFVTGSAISTAQSQFETIFDATKSRYS